MDDISIIQLQERKMFVMFGLFFVGNSISNGLVSTGAFEITVHEDSPDSPVGSISYVDAPPS